MEEEWRKVAINDGYEVSNMGRVRSIPRIVTFTYQTGPMAGKTIDRREKGRLLKFFRSGPSRRINCVVLCRGEGNHELDRCIVAHLVWIAFKGPIPEGMWVCHKDGDTSGDSIDSLQLLTIPQMAALRNERNGWTALPPKKYNSLSEYYQRKKRGNDAKQ